MGRKDLGDEPYYGADSMRRSAVLDLPWETIASRGVDAVASEALARVANVGRGFVIHVDADVLDPAVMPAVDSPEPGGMDFDTLGDLLAVLAAHPRALAPQLTVYDPRLDPERICGRRVVELLAHVNSSRLP
jgi:arginase